MLVPVLLIALVVVGIALTLAGEWRSNRPAQWIGKPLASVAFVALGLHLGAWETTYGRIILLALVLALVGDILLIPKDKRAFLAGLVAFLLAHVAYAAAFLEIGVEWTTAAIATAAIAPILFLVSRWLLPHTGKLRGAVLAYMVVITAMVALAAGAVGNGHPVLIVIGAVAFYLSDLAVARNRFITPGIINRVWGLPLYYVAQVMLAYTIPLVASAAG